MSMLNTLKICTASCVLLAGSLILFAQHREPEKPTPLTVSAVEAADHVSLRLHNVTKKAVSAYSVILHLREGTKSGQMKAVHTVLVGSPRDNFLRVRQPGESWVDKTASFKRRSRDRTKKLKIEASLDYVLFSDGTRWGPDLEKRSVFLAGLRQGAAAEFGHLQNILRRGGSDALVSEIRRSLGAEP